MKVLVVGGAGYIGSITARRLVEANHKVVVIDNLSRGHRQAVSRDMAFYENDFGDSDVLDKIFKNEQLDAVVHFGALSLVGESIQKPAAYFENNVAKGFVLLDAMLRHQCKHLVFSSTAAVYGEPVSIPITESAVLNPTNPYGESKLLFEKALKWYSRAYELNYACLRYFNAAGALDDLGEDHGPETHLIPLVLQVAQGKRQSVSIFGDDYKTDDGTCIRDYVHVCDLADAHILALEKMLDGTLKADVFNLGTSKGFSVRQIIDSARSVTGHAIPLEVVPRRPGDPAVLIASNEKARKILGWKPQFEDIDKIIGDAWTWHRHYPQGYARSEKALVTKN